MSMFGLSSSSLYGVRSIWFRMRFSKVSSRSVSPISTAPTILPLLRTTCRGEADVFGCEAVRSCRDRRHSVMRRGSYSARRSKVQTSFSFIYYLFHYSSFIFVFFGIFTFRIFFDTFSFKVNFFTLWLLISFLLRFPFGLPIYSFTL